MSLASLVSGPTIFLTKDQVFAAATSAADSNPAPTPQSKAGTAKSYLEQVARHIPSEVITVYVAFLSAYVAYVQQLPPPSPDKPINLESVKVVRSITGVPWQTYPAFLLFTVLVVWLYAAVEHKSRKLPGLPMLPLFKTGAALIAFTAWVNAIPYSPLTAWFAKDFAGVASAFSGVLLIVVTVLLSLASELWEEAEKVVIPK